MILTLAKNGMNFTHGNERSYDPWGGPGHTGDPTQGYCANLGHVTDDESGLIYMRARYYEPSTGRFLSEDPARDGANWYVYCGNEPVLRLDSHGTVDQEARLANVVVSIAGVLQLLGALAFVMTQSFTAAVIGGAGLLLVASWIGAVGTDDTLGAFTFWNTVAMIGFVNGWTAAVVFGEPKGDAFSPLKDALGGLAAYCLVCLLFLQVVGTIDSMEGLR